jgi:hypothetical protein
MGKMPKARAAAEVMLRQLGDDSDISDISLSCRFLKGALPSNESEEMSLVLLPRLEDFAPFGS